MRSVNPATGESIRDFTAHSDDEVQSHIDSANRAFQDWKERSFEERADLFRNLAELLRDGAGELAKLMTAEVGKPIEQARGEAEKCGWVCEYFADHAADFLEAEDVDTEARSAQVQFEPLGAILAVMPWNFPFWQVFRFAAPTMMAGNTALLTHASNVLGCAEEISALFEEAGFPEGVFDHLNIDNETTAEVIKTPEIRGVALTGSVGAGRSVASTAGSALVPCVLELGGSDPFVVLDDCDVERAVEIGTYARMMNNGQSCIAAKRFIVEDGIYGEFVDRFQDAIEALTVGDPTDPDVDVGPMARADLRDELHRQVTESIDAGATCLVGGTVPQRDGYFYEPTLLVDVEPGQPAFDEETFGPAAAVIRADDTDHAIELANRSTFGLGASIWTDADRGHQLASRLQAGCVFVNQMVKSDPRLPFGGIKDSGIGRELSRHGIMEFVNKKTVWVE